MEVFLLIIIVVIVLLYFLFKSIKPPEEFNYNIRKEHPAATAYYSAHPTKSTHSTPSVYNSNMICPHCQHQGKIITKSVKLKKGISGAKATGALLTGGLSIFATGLSRKEKQTEAHCDNCSSTWYF